MCGIAGIFAAYLPSQMDMLQVVRHMSDRLKHRGPDDAGAWIDNENGMALAHRRLSILDLSPAGHQPMLSPCGRYVVTFNGEIYNHLEIRGELESECLLEGYGESCAGVWRGHSDTETLIAAIAGWGLERTLRKAVGMFAFALWDREIRTLYLVRDRMGEKPLYYGMCGGALLFASELKALKGYPGFQGEVNREALMLLLRHAAIPTPYTIYRGIYKLQPGTVLALKQSDITGDQLPVPIPYWSLREVALEGQNNQFPGSAADAAEELERLLRQSIAGQMVADVPLGAFLSGGIDSSTVVALMQSLSRSPAQTFTIGFHETGYDEAAHAHAVATHLGTKHTELYVTHLQAMAVVPRLQELYDEPFADASQIPTFLVSELAKQHVTVSLSGDGGDELFGGYNRYLWAPSIWRRMHWLPRSIRLALAGVLTTLPASHFNEVFRRLNTFLPAGWRYANPADKLNKLADVFAARTPEEIYSNLVSHWRNPAIAVKGGNETFSLCTGMNMSSEIKLAELEHRMMFLDAVSYLPDDILVKVDRAAMGVSLETRVPFLDHRVVEFAWRLPLNMKIRHGMGKWLLRNVLDKYVPRELIERPKMGFGIPLDAWLRSSLCGWAEDLLAPDRLAKEGYFHPRPIRDMWQEHLAGRGNHGSRLWNVLAFQSWLEMQRQES